MRWQVQRHHITSTLKHGSGKIPLVEVDIRPAFLLAFMSDKPEKGRTEREQVPVQVVAQTALLKPSP